MIKNKRGRHLGLFLAICLVLNGCCFLGKGKDPTDPFEPFNRTVFVFNDQVDKAVVKPAAYFYQGLVPAPARMGVTNFFSNLNSLPTTANDILQGNFKWAFVDMWRFLINSTVGILGIIDVAQHMGLPPHTTDFGITLAVWGLTNPPYLVLPLFGPSSVNDTIALPVDYYSFTVYPYINPWSARYQFLGVYYINFRSNLLSFSGLIDQASFDPYVFQRNAYLQSRQYMVEVSKKGFIMPTASTPRAAPGPTTSVIPDKAAGVALAKK